MMMTMSFPPFLLFRMWLSLFLSSLLGANRQAAFCRRVARGPWWLPRLPSFASSASSSSSPHQSRIESLASPFHSQALCFLLLPAQQLPSFFLLTSVHFLFICMQLLASPRTGDVSSISPHSSGQPANHTASHKQHTDPLFNLFIQHPS